MAKVMMKGNEALAEAAVRAGCRLYCGYPITPQTEIMEYLSARLPEVGGHFIQSESEVAGISMILGGACTGYRVMTGSSGTGFSLKQEGISWMAADELPGVIVNVCRYGSGLGLISPGQDAYIQATKGGGHGSYHAIVYGPSTIQEMVDLTGLAFDKADEYRNPVIMLSDGALGQMMEPVEFPDFQEVHPNKDWTITGKGKGRGHKITTAIYTDPKYDQHVREKYARIAAEEQRWESLCTEDAAIVLVAYGTSGRVCRQAVQMARKKGMKLGLIRPVTLWPFPVKAFEQPVHTAKAFVTVEMSALGQMVEDVRLTVNGRKPVFLYSSGMAPPREAVILQMAEDILDGRMKEVL
ncbi:3-methyl-2-oxobutanoate dehydrogenase subunit VorB [Bacilliculturomica massiliensis]|uniref:3-methyl-2-oxobutanoate dehydrogenase subunit VorB n=1 Tax=Bacilliculturomica massiliensis TaxID=1917867 RepID=UPI001FE8FCEE|nr:3-methyl-2-oxobutanoate dehydrogenase subunit VorB [Bacilliculturomica massiliensis]